MSKQVFVRKEVGDIFNGMCVNVKLTWKRGRTGNRGEIRYSGLSDSVGFISGRTDQVSFTGRNGVRTFCSDRPLCP